MNESNKLKIFYTSISAFVIGIMLFFIVYGSLNIENFGDLGEWFGVLVAIIGFLFVIIQISDGRKQFIDSNTSSVKLAIRFETTEREYGEMGNISVKKLDNPKYSIWVTNDGKAPGSFSFVGVCPKSIYDKEIKNGEDGYKKIIDECEDPRVQRPFEEPISENFELIEPGAVSNEKIVFFEKGITYYFGDERELTVVYMNPLGKPYGRDILITD